MQLNELVRNAQESISVRRVFGDPYEKDGVTLITAAKVSGGGGGGGGHDDKAEGEGGGFGMGARPAGAYVVREGKVTWQPAVDVNKLFATLGAVMIAWMFTRVRIEKIRVKARRD
ncbi:MAG TPA: spore germination protein GerW family protein [Nitriliruptorales bacterium]|nr:spore germination protein GerW family protein [Nitriliruptorales bacterium]